MVRKKHNIFYSLTEKNYNTYWNHNIQKNWRFSSISVFSNILQNMHAITHHTSFFVVLKFLRNTNVFPDMQKEWRSWELYFICKVVVETTSSILQLSICRQVIASAIQNEVRAVISPPETAYKLERNKIKSGEILPNYLAQTWHYSLLMWHPCTILHCPSSSRKEFMKFTIFGLDIWSTRLSLFLFISFHSGGSVFPDEII